MDRTIVHQITSALGSDAICAELNVKHHSIRYAKFKGRFTASWYGVLSEMCAESGIECPKSAFTFRPRTDKIGTGKPENKGGVRKPGKSDTSKASAGSAPLPAKSGGE